MKKRGLIKGLEEFEWHHRVLLFVIVMILTIILSRTISIFYNPNPTIFGFELHHFDYGLLILFISFFLLLFGKKKILLHLLVGAIGFGLILDELWYVRSVIVDPGKDNLINYFPTLPVVIILAGSVIFVIFVINYIINKSK